MTSEIHLLHKRCRCNGMMGSMPGSSERLVLSANTSGQRLLAPCSPRQAGRCSRRQRCSSPNESGAFDALLDLAGCSSLIAPRQVA
jgi:hypothetical protein